MKTRVKKKSFWMGIVGLVLIVIQSFGVKIDAPVINELMSAVGSVLVMMGILVDDTKKANQVDTKEENITEIE